MFHNRAMVPEFTGTVGEPVVLNLRKNRTREFQSSQVRMNIYDSKDFSFD